MIQIFNNALPDTVLESTQQIGPNNLVLTKVLVQSLGELVQSRRNLQPLLENSLLPLNLNSLRPLHEPVQIPLRRQRPSDPKLLRTLLEQRIHHLLLKHATKKKKKNHQIIPTDRAEKTRNRNERENYRLLLGRSRELYSFLGGLKKQRRSESFENGGIKR